MLSEDEVRDLWARRKIFAKSVSARRKGRRFVFFEGPPGANGVPHIGHALTRAYKDIVLRYKTMRGYYVPRVAGWDTHGLPVEIEVEKELGLNAKKDIEEYGIVKFNKKCRQSVWKYKDIWEDVTEKFGFWIDLKNAYITYQNKYIESLWWIIKEIYQKKLLYEADKTLTWCPRCGTGLSSHELAQGYKKITDLSVYVRFYSRTQKATFLVWTTTPWTLPANVAIAVNQDIDYAAVNDRGEVFVLARSLKDVLFPEASVVWTKKGRELEGQEYHPLYPRENMPYKIVLGDFVSDGEGTGIVHIAPAFGADDLDVARAYGMPVLKTVDEEGKFLHDVPIWGGLPIRDTNPLIVKDLERKGILWKTEPYEHDYPHCWRCKSPLIYFAKKAFWIRMSSLRKELVRENKKVRWVPRHVGEGRFGEWVSDAKDWAFSRERYWGTPLPLYRCSACENLDAVGSLEELSDRAFKRGNRYIFLRHGYALSNAKGISYSVTKGDNYHLTPKGKKQASLAAGKLQKMGVDLIISSDLARTRETAMIVAQRLGKDVIYDSEMQDIHWGEMEGRSIGETNSFFGSVEERFWKSTPGGESWNDLKKRMHGVISKLENKYKSKTILLVGHADPLWFMEAMARGTLEENETPKIPYPKHCVIRKTLFKSVPRNSSGELDLHRPFVDEVTVKCSLCGKEAVRIKELADVWFDSGAMPFASRHYPFENKKEVDSGKLFPADFITEAIDQTRGWFYTLLAVSAILGKGVPYKNVISLEFVLDKNGKKMSKSEGNFVAPQDIINQYGADVLRWYFYTINNPGDSKLFDRQDLILKKRNFLDLLANSLRFYKMYEGLRKKSAKKTILDEWVLKRADSLAYNMTKHLDEYDVTRAARELESFVADDLSRWYIRRSRDHIKKTGGAVLRDVLLKISAVAAPFVPYTSEAVYRELKGKKTSVHLEDWPKGKKAAGSLFAEMDKVRSICSAALEARARAGIKVRQPLGTLRVKKLKLKNKGLIEIIKDEVNVKEVVHSPGISKDIELDLSLTDELREEGEIRELVRAVQDRRKKKGLMPRDLIILTLKEKPNFKRNHKLIMREVNAKSIVWSGNAGKKDEFSIKAVG